MLGVQNVNPIEADDTLRSGFFAVYYGQITPTIRRELSRYPIVIVAEDEVGAAASLQRDHTRVASYMNILGLPRGDPMLQKHPEWALEGSDGKPITFWYGSSVVCNPASGWSHHLASLAKSVSESYGVGIFTDDVHPDPWFNSDVYNATVYGVSWTEAVRNILVRIKESIGSEVLIYNGEFNEEYLIISDAWMYESFLASWLPSQSTPSNPKYTLQPWQTVYQTSKTVAEIAERLNKGVLALSYGPADDRDRMFVSFATTKLFNFSFFYTEPSLSSLYQLDLFDLKLGNPIMEEKDIENVHVRVYEKGFVVVNPSDYPFDDAISVPQGWQKMVDHYTKSTVIPENGSVKISVPPRSGRVYSLGDATVGESSSLLSQPYLQAIVIVSIVIVATLVLRPCIKRVLRSKRELRRQNSPTL